MFTFPRASGIILHPSSLPGPWGIGGLGAAAYTFIDQLATAHQRFWQVLPLGPIGPANSPYQSPSSFAGNTLLIDLSDFLPERSIPVHAHPTPFAAFADLLHPDDLRSMPSFPAQRVAYELLIPWRESLLAMLYARFRALPSPHQTPFQTWRAANADWVETYALYIAIKRAYGNVAWIDWPRPLAVADSAALITQRDLLRDQIAQECFAQWLFFAQWDALREYAHARDIAIIGDLPFYPASDSVDVWYNQRLFDLDRDGRPNRLAGVPPDLFSATGQLWGNPIYRWDAHQATGYAWWNARIAATLRLVDIVRIDHFRAFHTFWEVSSGETTAQRGRWVEGPGEAFFTQLSAALGGALPIIAEDLGSKMEGAIALRQSLGLPGMKLLQRAFSDDDAERRQFATTRTAPGVDDNTILYLGTHDNATVTGWWENEANPTEQARAIARYQEWNRGPEGGGTLPEPHWMLITLALQSSARVCILTLPDLLGADNTYRMNYPGTQQGNWEWRATIDEVKHAAWERLAHATTRYQRDAPSPQEQG